MGLFSGLLGGSDDAQKYLQQALQAYQTIQTPTIDSEMIKNLPTQADTSFAGISLDPAARAAQSAALKSYTDIAGSEGLDPTAKAALMQTEQAATEQARGEQGAIGAQAQAQGMGGSNFDLTQRAIAAQGASNTAATQGLDAAAMAEQNRQQALAGMGSLGGSMESQQFGEGAAKAQAQDVINAQNTAARQGQTYYNANLPQVQFQNEMAKAGGMAGVNAQQASAAENARQAGLGFLGGLAGTGGMIAGGMMGGPMGAMAGRSIGQGVTGGTPQYSSPAGPSTPFGYNPPRYGPGYSKGGPVAGKAEVDGNDDRNDTVDAKLSPGEYVVDRETIKKNPKVVDVLEFMRRNKGK